MDPELYQIHLGPDAGEMAGAGASTQIAPETPESGGDEPLSPEQANSRPDLDGGGAEGDAGTGAVGAGAPPADPNVAANRAPSIREAAAAYGMDLSRYSDDHSAFLGLIQQAQNARQNEYFTNLGRQYAPHAPQMAEFLRQQQAQQAAQNQAPKPWQPPEFDERWLNLVDRDENSGAFVAKPGVNPAIAEAVQKYADWNQRFQRNPMAMLDPWVEERATEIANKIVGAQMQTFQARTATASIVEAHAPWLYATDEQGRRLIDPQSGRYVPTPLGARYAGHVATLRQAGVTDARQQDAIARQMLGADLDAGQAQATTQQAVRAMPQARAAGRTANVNAGQAVDPSRRAAVAAATEPDPTGKSLSELLRDQFAAEGVTDATFANMWQA